MTKEFKVYITIEENGRVAGCWISEAIATMLIKMRERKLFKGNFTIDVVEQHKSE